MIRTTRLAVIAGFAVLLVPLALVACGDDTPTAEAFIKNAEKVDQQHEAVAQPLWDKLDALMANLGPDDKLPAETADTMTKLFTQEEDFANAVSKMGAPNDAQPIRDEAVAALRAEAAFGRKVVGSVTADTSLGQLTDTMNSDESTALQDRRHNACLSMQKYADDHAVKVDMTC